MTCLSGSHPILTSGKGHIKISDCSALSLSSLASDPNSVCCNNPSTALYWLFCKQKHVIPSRTRTRSCPYYLGDCCGNQQRWIPNLAKRNSGWGVPKDHRTSDSKPGSNLPANCIARIKVPKDHRTSDSKPGR